MNWANLHGMYDPTSPGLWILAGIIGAIFLLVVGSVHARRRLDRHMDTHLLDRLVVGRSAVVPVVRGVFIISALILMYVAWLRPQTDGPVYKFRAKGLDIVVCLDFSKSMHVRDMAGSRLDQAKRELARLISKLAGDRLGFVAFSGTVMTYPLTTDHESTRLFWEDLQPEDMPVGGTAIGKALQAAEKLLLDIRGKVRSRAQVVVLLTDGEDNTGDPDPMEVAKDLREQGIRVYTIGIGSTKPELIPKYDEKGKQVGYQKEGGKYATSRLDENLLRKIADMTGGAYIRSSKSDFGTDRLIAYLSHLKRTAGKVKTIKLKNEEYHWFLYPAAILLLLELLVLGDRRIFGASRRDLGGSVVSAQGTDARGAREGGES